MPDLTKVLGVASGDIVAVDGVASGDIDKIGGASMAAAPPPPPSDPPATMWMLGEINGRLYASNDPNNWPDQASRVDTGNGTPTAMAYGKSGSTGRWITGWDHSTNEIRMVNSGSQAYIYDSNNWIYYDFGSPARKFRFGDRGNKKLAYNPDSGTWIAGGDNAGNESGEYKPLRRSVDGGDSWTVLTIGLDENRHASGVTYVSASTFVAVLEYKVWISTDDGVSWAEAGHEGTAGRCASGIAYNAGGGRSVLAHNWKYFYSDDNWATSTTVTSDSNEASAFPTIYSICYVKGGINAFVAATQTGLIQTSSDGTTQWNTVADLGKDGYSLATDHHTIVLSTDGGKVWSASATSSLGDADWVEREDYGSDEMYTIACDVINAGMSDY